MTLSPFQAGAVASLLAGLATGIGAIPVFFFREISKEKFSILLGVSAGVMLAASSFSLIVPGIEIGESLFPGFGAYLVAAGIISGAVFLDLTDKCLPHEHFVSGHEGPDSRLRRIWLFIIAVTIHNFPEGMAVGVGFAANDPGGATSLAMGIGIQNIPEGLAVAMPLTGLGYARWQAAGIALLSGLVEPVGGILGAGIVSVFHPILPFALAFAAGAMLFVISDEIIPETHMQGRFRPATYGIMTGFVIMMLLDNLLG